MKDNRMTQTRTVALATFSLLALAATPINTEAVAQQNSSQGSSPPAMQMDSTAMQGAAKIDDSGTMKRADKDMGRVLAKL
jgi:hypothetical protein